MNKNKWHEDPMYAEVLGDLVPEKQNDNVKKIRSLKPIFEPEEKKDKSEPEKVMPIHKKISRAKTPSEIAESSYLMNQPLTLSTDDANNAWMKDQEPLNMGKVHSQWNELYRFIASNATVYLLPSGGDFQDQPYVANLGIVLPHLSTPTVVLAKFKSPPRKGEEDIGRDFFELWNKWGNPKYKIHMAPKYWEGTAELKYLHDNIYAGGWGQKEWSRTDRDVYDWFEEKFDMKIIRVEMTDEKLYHFDCMCFPITKDSTLVCTDIIKREERKQLESVTQVIPISLEMAHGGITNSIRVKNMILCASPICSLEDDDPEYKIEKRKIAKLEEICVDEGLEPVIFNLQEFEKSGAALSCLAMPLNSCDQAKSMIEE